MKKAPKAKHSGKETGNASSPTGIHLASEQPEEQPFFPGAEGFPQTPQLVCSVLVIKVAVLHLRDSEFLQTSE